MQTRSRLTSRLLTNTFSSLRRCIELLKPIVDERLKKEELLGKNWPGKPVCIDEW